MGNVPRRLNIVFLAQRDGLDDLPPGIGADVRLFTDSAIP